MYTDDKFCAPCCDNGLFQDGENYCTKCRNYLCLTCAKAHGQICTHEYNTRKNVRYNAWGDGTKGPRMTCRSEKYEVNEAHDDQQFKTGCYKYQVTHNRRSETKCDYEPTCLDHGRKTSKDFQKEASRMKLRRKEDYVSGGTESVPEERKQVSNQTADPKRQNFSARGGIVKVTKVSTDVERVKLKRCGKHPEMTIENFCNIHNDLCCEECLNKDHGQCVVQPVDEIAHGLFARGEVGQAVRAFEDLKEKNDAVIKKYEEYIESKKKTSQRVSNGKTEKKETETVKDEEAKLKRMHIKCTELDENISLSISEIKNAKESGSEVFTFITLQKNKRAFTNAKTKLQEITELQDMLPSEEERDIQQTNKNDETQAIQETTGTAIDREVITVGNDINTDSGIHSSGASEKGNENVLPNKTVIGDVILHTCGEYEREQSPKDQMNNYEIESQETETFRYGNELDKDLKLNKCKEPDNATNDISASTNKSQPIKKNVGFVTSGIFRKPFKNRVKTYGLVTEYYLDDDNDFLDGIRVLRLQSAPPERLAMTHSETAQRPRSMNVMESREMEQWQNRKMLESVEHKKEFNECNELQPQTRVDNRTVRSKRVVKSTTNDFNDQLKTKQQYHTNKRKQLLRSRRENASFSSKKPSMSKKRQKEPTSKPVVRNYEIRTEAQQLKQWIKQTEEINQKYKKVSSKISTNSAENEIKETDEVNKVDATNMNDRLDNFNDEPEELPTVPLIIKEATLIKRIHPHDRQSSAKSRTSDSEESLYNSQTYASPPKSQLFLTEEQIIRLPNDERVCEINSISCLPDGRIVVSDYSNMVIKMFRVGRGKASVLTLDEPPHDVTVVSNSIFAVVSGLAYDMLLLVSVGQYLSINRRFKTGCVCKAISSYESHIYLLCLYRYKTEVRILTIDGIVSFRLDLGHAIPSPKSIAVKASNGRIYISDQTRGIFTVEMGKIVSRSFDRNIENYIGVEVDINNNVFVCTKNPCGIYEINYDEKHLMPILLGGGMENLKAIAYNVANNSLVVGCANSETIQIYKINDTVSLKKNAKH